MRSHRTSACIAGLAIALALFASAARAQDEGELADVPTASDEAVLGTSPLREAPAPVLEREPPTERPAEIEPDELGAVDEQGPWPGEPQPPVYETFWFWTAIAAVALGITACVVVAVTTDAPASSVRADLVRADLVRADLVRSGLVLRF